MSDHRSGIVRTGLHEPLESAADAILFPHLARITRSSDKADVLTPWKEQDRRKREVYVSAGTPDGALRRGIFTRAAVGHDSGLGHLSSLQAQKPSKNHGATAWDSE